MEKSYVYTKRFIDNEVKRLNRPLSLDSSEAPGLSEKQLQQILTKVNIKIRRHNRNLFPAQINNQIVQQILKIEQEKLNAVNERLTRVKYIMKPLAIDVKITKLDDILKELPESKYLFASEQELENKNREEEGNNEIGGNGGLVQDGEERVESLSEQIDQELKEKYNFGELLERYDSIRSGLIELNEELIYKREKLSYLSTLNDKLDFLESESLVNEINRFKVLVERLSFKSKNRSPPSP
ncbi:uncharacterized protein PRCAT00000769001 [Priceomyces carsonii]|uniref:uncharacterized protein n=1 Tax=Priceomyces carsonii TaxID=28549 RepID=UPI002ED963A0|nr:unnamed protein product [Priceomyces carsonii]